MYIGHGSLCVVSVGVCVCLCIYLSVLAVFPHYYTDPDVTWGNCRGCPVVVHALLGRFAIVTVTRQYSPKSRMVMHNNTQHCT